MGKWIKRFFIVLFTYLAFEAIFWLSKREFDETVVIKIIDKRIENIDVGWGDARHIQGGFFSYSSIYKYIYEIEALERDGWIGNIKYIYSDVDLQKNKVYGLEIEVVETTSNFQFWFIPAIWCDYAFHIVDVYNYKPEMKGVDFQRENSSALISKIEDTYNFWNWNNIRDPKWSDTNGL
jgi:hypothetical protein